MRISTVLLALSIVSIGAAQGFDPANYSSLKWQNVGPARGGRSVACVGVRTRPNEFYFGATGGGLWKSTDAGVSWSCVTDGFITSSSVGAVAVSDSNPDVVYLGTGERDIRGNISEGDGVYKSTDAGKTWKHVGLESTRTVSKIVVDPKNPDVVYVAALGHVFGKNDDRGVFKSTDGGKTWTKILFESDKAGAVEITMDPADSNTLYAATWEAWRTPYFMNSGGEGSKFWKTTDAGATWKDITRNQGLPKGVVGKIGISVSPVKHERVWAIVEATDGGIFRSDDSGTTWTKITDEHKFTQRAWYYSHIYADTKEPDKVFCLNVSAFKSTDGGKAWSGIRTPHGDNHDLWVNPDDANRMIESNDGGAAVSIDGGKTWTKENYATAQFYHVVADNHFPYRIYGAQQDNSSVMVSPSEPNRADHANWNFSAGGESGYMAVKPNDPDIVYGGNYSGNIERLNTRTGLAYSVDPWPDNPMGHGAKDLDQRFQWTFPIVTSPHNPNVIYSSSQYLFRTDNGGQSWKQISPDLTRNDKSKMESSGGPITQDNTSIEYYGTIFTVAESPAAKDEIWTGSDDGLVYLTRDGGKTWDNVTPKDMPHWGRVSMVEASPHDAGTAYLSVNNYQNDDLKPYFYRTHDFGKTWTKITSGIDQEAFARVCREDLRRKGLLYAGTEKGAYVSFDDGEHWQSLQLNLPLTPVHDLALKDDDLIAATHGRSFWILHGTSVMENLTAAKPTKPVLYQPVDRYNTRGALSIVDYYIPAAAKKVAFEFLDSEGKVVAGQDGDKSAGLHRFNKNLSHPPFHSFSGMVLWSGFPQEIPCPPGMYTVKMNVDGDVQSKNFKVLKDPRVAASEKDLVEQYRFSLQIVDRISEANDAVIRIRDTKSQIDKVVKADASLKPAADALELKLSEVEDAIHQGKSKAGEDPLNFPVRLNDKLAGVQSAVQSGSMKPPAQTYAVFNMLSKQLQVRLDKLKDIEAKDLAAFNSTLKAKGVAAIVPKTPKPDNKPFSFDDDETTQRGGRRDEDSEGE